MSLLQTCRTTTGRYVPARWKVSHPCPPAKLAGTNDRVPVCIVGVGALVLLADGEVDRLNLESVIGHPLAVAYLVVLVLFAIAAVLSTCVLTLGLVMRTWGLFVLLLASAAVTRWLLYLVGVTTEPVGSPLMPVAFYLGLAFAVGVRGIDLVQAGRNLR